MVLFICGPGGSGKDTIGRRVMEKRRLTKLPEFTTRPMRAGEENGRYYKFVSPKIFFELYSNRHILEFREYKVEDDTWYYGTETPERLDIDFILWGPLEQYKSLKSENNLDVLGIYLNVDPKERLKRMLDRVSYTDSKKYDFDISECCRRTIHDIHDFRDADNMGFDKIVYNSSISVDEAVHQILEVYDAYKSRC